MFQPLHTGRLGLTAQQRGLDTIGNNIANLSTTGYKKVRLDFQDNLYTRMFNKTDMDPDMNLQRGTGVREYQTARIHLQGALVPTGRSLDFALEGHGYFVLQNPNPVDEEELDQYFFTRDGAFYLSDEEGENFLVDEFGRYVMDTEGERIIIPDPENLFCDSMGNLTMMENGEEIIIAQLGLADFTNRGGLASVGENAFVQTVNSGEMLEVTAAVHHAATESSNVDLAEEMTRMIRTQRAYQIASRCVTTADQMMQVANAIRS
ncbi:MAG: flagellar hook-basal body protein [Oscillospiraceae bacterium]|jgi:flagellar basal-body rod protein FlgG|nr:flagellar hook-basal body protein [Oscillospiraceae bacterium]